MIRYAPLILTVALLLSGCEREARNPPTEPAASIASSEAAPGAAGPADIAASLPGAGPISFVGRWAGNAAWCANTTGAEQPITITPLRFEGYEHSCAITALDQVVDGYVVNLACQAGGAATRERVRLSVQDDALRLTWLNRNDAEVLLVHCPAAKASAAPPP